MKKFSDETKKRMSESAKARCTPEWRATKSEKMRLPVDEKRIKELYESGMTKAEVASEMGIGRKLVSNTMIRCGIKARKAVKRNQWGDLNHMWKGDEASINKFHTRLYRRLGKPSKCDVCLTTDKNKSYDWANLTGNYSDISDFKRMCRSCHWKYDKKILNLGRGLNGHS